MRDVSQCSVRPGRGARLYQGQSGNRYGRFNKVSNNVLKHKCVFCEEGELCISCAKISGQLAGVSSSSTRGF